MGCINKLHEEKKANNYIASQKLYGPKRDSRITVKQKKITHFILNHLHADGKGLASQTANEDTIGFLQPEKFT